MLEQLLDDIRACHLCEGLPLVPRPILQASSRSRVLIAGQAPGRITHAKGRPFDDPSGERLRSWLGVSKQQFYDADQFAIVPMGFCFPGTGSGGDLAPRRECAAAWRTKLLAQLGSVRLTLAIGQFAQAWHFPQDKISLTEKVRANHGSSSIIALPHPSPRNLRWLRNNPWFETEILPMLQRNVAEALL